MSGAWRVTFSLWSLTHSGQSNTAWLHLNGQAMEETYYRTYSSSGSVYTTGGRELIMEAREGETIELRATYMSGFYFQVIYCAEYISKM